MLPAASNPRASSASQSEAVTICRHGAECGIDRRKWRPWSTCPWARIWEGILGCVLLRRLAGCETPNFTTALDPSAR